MLKSIQALRPQTLFSFFVLLGLVVSQSSLFGQSKTPVSAYNEAMGLLKEKNYEAGLEAMEAALTIAAEKGEEKIIGLATKNAGVAAINLGNSKLAEKDFDAALAAYEKAKNYNPNNSGIDEGIARVYEEQGNLPEAVKQYIISGDKGQSEDNPDRVASRYKRAMNVVGKQFVAKNYDAAIETGEAYLSLKTDEPEVFYYLSKSYAEKNENDKSIELINQAIELAGKESPDKYHYAQGSTYEILGKNKEAVQAYKKIVAEPFKAQADYRIRELEGEDD